jgi:hypothetical protein
MIISEGEIMNAGTFFVVLVLAVIVILDIRYLMKNGIDSCSGDCGSCGPSCRWANDIKKAQRKIRFQNKLKKLLHLS